MQDLLRLKTVCRMWYSQIKRAIKDGNDACRFAIQHRRFPSAKDALLALDGGKRFQQHLVSRKCKLILKAWPQMTRPSDKYCFYNKPASLLWDMLMNRMQTRLLTKSLRFLQSNDRDELCIFSDVYGCDTGDLLEFVFQCKSAGVEARAFEFDYPGTSFSGGYVPPKRFKERDSGYPQYYRGKIAGVFI